MLLNAQTLSRESKNLVVQKPANQPLMEPNEPRSPAIAQILAGIRDDVARLNRILRDSNCDAEIRGIDGSTLVTIARWVKPRSEAEAGGIGHRSIAKLARSTPALCAPIYDAQGRLFGSLDLITVEIDRSGALTNLLRAMIESAAHAITKRLFRASYRDCWIIAAQPHDAAEDRILLAVDYGRRLVGADRPGRQLLQMKGRPFVPPCSMSAYFKLNGTPFRERGGDAVHRLFWCDDNMPYSALITPPDPGPHESSDDERLLPHARPRLDTIGDHGNQVLRDAVVGGLAPRLIRRIQHYINSNLDSTLNVEALAASVGLSASYFSRAFVRSLGTTPHDYVVRRRISRAQQLLTESDLELAEIALATGFADQSHFSRRFHQLVGLPPKAFRQRHR